MALRPILSTQAPIADARNRATSLLQGHFNPASELVEQIRPEGKIRRGCRQMPDASNMRHR
jgi:hypothetical protein